MPIMLPLPIMAAAHTGAANVGRYVLYDAIASGGMATIYFASLAGVGSFRRTVAIKRLHPHLATEREFVSMLLDEARLAARIVHPNVVPTLDIVSERGEAFIVMEYVHGESLSKLMRAARRDQAPPPLGVTSAVVCGVLHGLHAAHEARDERGAPLGMVHRDVSPHNILVGQDGIARLVDFGVAKAAGRLHTTRDGQIKGKLGYMAPEQLRGEALDRRTDVYAAGVVLWEMLTGKRLFDADSEGATVTNVLERIVDPPSVHADLPHGLDDVVLRALTRKPGKRFEDARQMARALEAVVPLASPTAVTEWVEARAGDALAERSRVRARIDASASTRPGASKNARWWIAASIGGAVVVGGGIVAWRTQRAATPSATVPVDPAPEAKVVPPPPPLPSASAAESTSASPSAAPAAEPHAQRMPVRAGVAAAPHVSSTPKRNCNPPYFVDAQGLRHYKPECPLE
jgi:serine/threonine protein kinase